MATFWFSLFFVSFMTLSLLTRIVLPIGLATTIWQHNTDLSLDKLRSFAWYYSKLMSKICTTMWRLKYHSYKLSQSPIYTRLLHYTEKIHESKGILIQQKLLNRYEISFQSMYSKKGTRVWFSILPCSTTTWKWDIWIHSYILEHF